MAKKKKKPTTDNVIDATEKLKEAAQNGDKTAFDALKEIQENYQAQLQAEDGWKKVKKECKEREDQERAALKNVIEDSLPASPKLADYKAKVEAITSHWGELEDVKAHNVEEKKEAREKFDGAKERFRRSVEESAQLTLDFTGSDN